MRRVGAAAILGGLGFVGAGVLATYSPVALARLGLLGAALAAATIYDLGERRIPNRLVLPAAAACSGLAIGSGIAPAAMASGLAIVAVLTALSLAKPESLGMGDVKLALLVAVALGSAAAPALLIGLACAATIGAALICARGRAALTTALPLAPFICLGALTAIVL